MAFFRCSSGGGSGGYSLKKTDTMAVSSGNGNITGLTTGKEYIVAFAYSWTNSNYSAEISSIGGTSSWSKVNSGSERAFSSNTSYLNWIIAKFTASAATVSVSFSSMTASAGNIRYVLFEAV